jgi:hypothetical protein
LYDELPARSVEDPLTLAITRFIENGSTSGRSNGVQQNLASSLDIETVAGCVHHYISLVGRQLGDFLGQVPVPVLQAIQESLIRRKFFWDCDN